ncbi:IucA/IucC family protein [Streptomyces sp. NBC_01304]|uniref:IucA/IucC family protein n=1 Tax=Streptomyces sp. NBC_01304 TaxID=2903818 RepID=UPI003FA352F3
MPLDASGTALLVPVRYWSPTGWHRFGAPVLEGGRHGAPPVDAVTLAALLGREAATATASLTGPAEPGDDGGASGDGADLVGRVADSVRRTTTFLADRRRRRDAVTGAGGIGAPAPGSASGKDTSGGASGKDTSGGATGKDASGGASGKASPAGRGVGPAPASAPAGTPALGEAPALTEAPDLFLSAEQSLLLGHPLHPTAKSREGLSEAESRRYSPELCGSFPLHWMSVDGSVLAQDSAWTERGRTVSARRLVARLAGAGLALPEDRAVLPLHPWQARELVHRPEVAELLDAGLLTDLGPHGDPWYPTSSVRTLYRSGAPAMLKLSLGLRITNSRRENLLKELQRGVEVHRLLRSGLADQWQSAHPQFDIVRDPAWLAVMTTAGEPVPGLDVMIRNNPFAPGDDFSCIAGLVSPRPAPQPGIEARPAPMRSRLATLVTRLAARTGRPRGAVAAEWFLRYLEQVVRPVLWLDSEAGIALEAHQQNTLVLLDPEGWPAGGRYRDNQGYYFRESRRTELDKRLPGIGEHSDTFVSDEVTDERFAYYLAINNVLGLIGAFGSQELADERLLLAAFRGFLSDAATGPDRLRSPLPAQLLDTPVLRCKANLLTRLHGLDELVGPVDTQSVYVTIANPLHQSAT